MNQINCKVNAFWDADIGVWVAESEDVPGLATEADTLETLSEKLRDLVPELLQLNRILPDNQGNMIVIELNNQ